MSILSNSGGGFVSAGGGGYQIDNSLRFRASNSAYLSRTFGSPTDNKKWTWSGWVKRSNLGGALGAALFTSTNGAVSNYYYGMLYFANDSLSFYHATTVASANYTTTAKFRDPSAHLHVVCVVDTTLATPGDRAILYVNGVRMSTPTPTTPALNATLSINDNGHTHEIGRRSGIYATDMYYDGYLSDIYFIDGQALTPSDFGETNADGVWVPKAYSGTYGTNGFHLDFKDAALTAGSNAGLGKDVSGNGNYWTTNTISVTAGVTYDHMVDTPTNNYAVLNPLDSFITGGVTISAANLTVGLDRSTYNCWSRVTFPLPSSDTWYFECVQTAQVAAASIGVGVISTDTPRNLETGASGLWHRAFLLTNGNKYTASGGAPTSSAYSSAVGLNVVVGVAVNMNTGRMWFRNASGWFNSGDPTNSTDANAAFSDLVSSGKAWLPFIFASNDAVTTSSINVGQRPFAYDPPTGFQALCTANLSITSPTASGTFTGNAAADGPFVWIGGVPTTLTINGNAVTFGTHADKTAGGFKLRTASASYNTAGSNTWTATFASPSTKSAFAQPQPAQGNP